MLPWSIKIWVPDQNSFYRDFDLTNDFGIVNDFTVSSVEFGVEQILGPVSLTLNIYSTAGPFPSGFPGSLTLQGTSNYIVDVPDNLTIVSVPLSATIPAGSIMVYELRINLGATNSFFPGSNAAGQTGVSWIAAPACGISVPTNFSSIGFPNVMMIMNVVGEEVTSGPLSVCSTGNPRPIPAAGTSGLMTPAIASVADVGLIGTDYTLDNITLNSIHTFAGDLEIILVSLNDALVNLYLNNIISYISIHDLMIKLLKKSYFVRYYDTYPKNINDIRNMVKKVNKYIERYFKL